MIRYELDILEQYEDEILYSWLSRMFWWHGYLGNTQTNIRKFHSSLFGHNSKTVTNILIPYNLKALADKINMPENQYFKSPDDIIQNASIIPFYTSFILHEDKEKIYKQLYTNNKVRIPRALIGLNNLKSFSIKYYQFKFCYHCWEENGHCYFNREHQIPGNNVCYKHKTPLQYITGNSNNYFLFNNNIQEFKNYKSCLSHISEYQVHVTISSIIHDIFENGFNDGIVTLKSKLRKVMINEGYLNGNFYFFENIEVFFSKYRKFNILDIKSKDLVSALFSTVTIPNPIIYLTLILFLFGSLKAYYEYEIDDFEIKELTHNVYKSITKVKRKVKGSGIIYYNDIIQKRKDNDYVLIKKAYKAHYAIKHVSCGHEWITKQERICDMNEILCPQCRTRKREQDAINEKKLIVNSVNSEYEYITSYSSYWVIMHKLCGNTFTTSPHNFLEGNKTCHKCNRQKYIEKRIEQFNNFFKGEFEILEYKNSNNKTVILHNNEYCNGQFPMLIKDFYYRQKCPSCNMPKLYKNRY